MARYAVRLCLLLAVVAAIGFAATTVRARRRGRALETSSGPAPTNDASPAPAKEPDPSADPARPASIPSTQRADNETKGGSRCDAGSLWHPPWSALSR